MGLHRTVIREGSEHQARQEAQVGATHHPSCADSNRPSRARNYEPDVCRVLSSTALTRIGD